jgi:hypothetical protein
VTNVDRIFLKCHSISIISIMNGDTIMTYDLMVWLWSSDADIDVMFLTLKFYGLISQFVNRCLSVIPAKIREGAGWKT